MVVWTQGRQLLHGHLESSCCLEIRFRCLAMFGSWKVHRISQLCFVPSFVMCFFMLVSDPCWSSLLSSQLLWSILSGWVAWLSHQSEHLSACFNPNVGWLHIWLILFQLRRSLSESDLLMLFYIILPVRYFFLQFVLRGLAMFSHPKFGIQWTPPRRDVLKVAADVGAKTAVSEGERDFELAKLRTIDPIYPLVNW